VPNAWLVDSRTKRQYSCDPGLAEVPPLRAPELEIEMKPEQIFEPSAALNHAQRRPSKCFRFRRLYGTAVTLDSWPRST
jgi:hypothetical protein